MRPRRAAFHFLAPSVLARVQCGLSMQMTMIQSTARHHCNNNQQQQQSWPSGLPASSLGLDPQINRFHPPMVHHEDYSFSDWPENHTFPMHKFKRLAHALTTTTSSNNLPRPLVRNFSDFYRPLDFHNIPVDDWLCGPLDHSFVDRFLAGTLSDEECRIIGFREHTRHPHLIRRTLLEVAGTVLTCRLAQQYGLAAHTAGGTHHATSTSGAGYTILNDVAVAAHVVTTSCWNGDDSDSKTSVRDDKNSNNNYGNVDTEDTTLLSPTNTTTAATTAQRVLVVDCDVHQGDGTAHFSSPDMPLHGTLFTLSLHCASNYPHPKTATSTLDVGLKDGMRDDEYLAQLDTSLTQMLEEVQPDLVIYNAGVDVYQGDRLGRLHLSEAGIRRRDRFVLETCVGQRGIPTAAVIGGGYDKDVDALARRHAIVHTESAYVWRKYKLWKRQRL